ncbi:MAG: MerR family transcriptional regulator [Chroococcidiopsidaceae cyanobacterium CP_BM_RX_35]|nr:MerR family transcriptional regulator [Chroococcidiopsidaceae cyanobacterium CP_BM_RX_35]
MKNLQQLAHHPTWGLDEFVQVTNDLLPQFLPETPANTRVREEVTPRLVRHYSSLEMLDEPLKEGREARYTYRHLLQMLLVRRLLASGYGASAINQLATSKDNSELEALLQGGVQLTVTPANPALAFLQQIQQRQSVETQRNACESSGDSRAQAQRSAGIASGSALPQAQPPQAATSDLPQAASPAQNQSPSSQWTRLEILPSLEIHLREDFSYPSSPQEQQNLLQHINQTLIAASIHRRSSK